MQETVPRLPFWRCARGPSGTRRRGALLLHSFVTVQGCSSGSNTFAVSVPSIQKFPDHLMCEAAAK